MYDFCSTITGILSIGIIILGIVGMRNSQKAKDAKDISKLSGLGSDDGEEKSEDQK